MITVELKLKVQVGITPGYSVADFIEDLDYDVRPPNYAIIYDTEIVDYDEK
jgi:hypothetical protein